MRKFYLLLFVSFSFGAALTAQVSFDWQNESFLNFAVNPAQLAESDAINVGIQHARKWRTVASSPVSYNLAAVVPFEEDRMAVGLMINSNEIGPLSHTGLSAHYAYAFPVGLSQSDRLSMGISARVVSLRFDQTKLVAADLDDQLIDGSAENTWAPPSINAGFHYTTGTSTYYEPVQFSLGGSFARFIPFADRFNTMVYSRAYQWYGSFGLDVHLFDETRLHGQVLLSNLERGFFRKAFRATLDYQALGWASVQYDDRRMLMAQLGVNLRLPQLGDDVIQISGSYGASFGTIGSQVGNGVSFGVNYQRKL